MPFPDAVVSSQRRLPIGAEPQSGGGTHFRVWAPAARSVAVAIDDAGVRPMEAEEDGYFAVFVPEARRGQRYWFELDGDRRMPDPVSRFQPDGPHGASEIVDPREFSWSDAGWSGPDLEHPIVYEMHVGTFTESGTWAHASRHLRDLARLGVSLIEVLPVGAFPGRFGWGYDGVCLFAPTAQYGDPDAFRAFVDEAHSLGLGVILDVVYNHLGPDGAVLQQFSPHYASQTITDWGAGFNFDGEHSGPVREFVLSNVAYWMDEFHLDGLRLDAVQALHDRSETHIVTDISRTMRAHAPGRRVWIVGEHEPQDASLLRDRGELDALWNDDFHHTAMVSLTGKREAYYTDYLGSPQEFVSAAKRGFLYQGQWYSWQRNGRGDTTRGLAPSRFVAFLQNHDQVANSAAGVRVHKLAHPGRYRALTALLLLGPWTPMLFQGQEFGASTPFLYFADHAAALAQSIRAGRRAFLWQFPTLRRMLVRGGMPDPSAWATFAQCKLLDRERMEQGPHLNLHTDLIALRRATTVLRDCAPWGLDGAVLGHHAFVLRFFGERPDSFDDERLLVVNLGPDQTIATMPEPLLAPPSRDHYWTTALSTEDQRYRGSGILPIPSNGAWVLPAESALLLKAVRR